MKKTTKLTAEFWRNDAEQRANAERILESLRREREARESRQLGAHGLEAVLRRFRRYLGRVVAG